VNLPEDFQFGGAEDDQLRGPFNDGIAMVLIDDVAYALQIIGETE
jgi:hypothetical protein